MGSQLRTVEGKIKDVPPHWCPLKWTPIPRPLLRCPWPLITSLFSFVLLLSLPLFIFFSLSLLFLFIHRVLIMLKIDRDLWGGGGAKIKILWSSAGWDTLLKCISFKRTSCAKLIGWVFMTETLMCPLANVLIPKKKPKTFPTSLTTFLFCRHCRPLGYNAHHTGHVVVLKTGL